MQERKVGVEASLVMDRDDGDNNKSELDRTCGDKEHTVVEMKNLSWAEPAMTKRH